jgi:hypothetical protein
MGRELLCQRDAHWLKGRDRRALVNGILKTQLARWADQLSRIPLSSPPLVQWLSDRVLEVRGGPVVVWVVITDLEVAVFWDAPAAVRSLWPASKRQEVANQLRDEVANVLSSTSAIKSTREGKMKVREM